MIYPVIEDDVNEIKQEVSSFRYELLGILKNNGMIIPASERKNSKSSQSSKGKTRHKNRRQDYKAALAIIGRACTCASPNDIFSRMFETQIKSKDTGSSSNSFKLVEFD